MPHSEMVALGTRIPKALSRRLRVHCVTADLPGMAFVAQAISEKLARETRRGRKLRR